LTALRSASPRIWKLRVDVRHEPPPPEHRLDDAGVAGAAGRSSMNAGRPEAGEYASMNAWASCRETPMSLARVKAVFP
jgi:hypothetical protein